MESPTSGFRFDEATLERLFGQEGAEFERVDDLKRYYVMRALDERIASDPPFRILVGPRGTGKTALFKIAATTEAAKGRHPVFFPTRSPFPHTSPDGWLSDLSACVPDALRKSPDVTIFMDDLDRGWTGSSQQVASYIALLDAALDHLRAASPIRLRLAMRSDIYYRLRRVYPSADKITGYVLYHEWTQHQILAMFAKRVLAFFGRDVADARLLEKSQDKLFLDCKPVIDQDYPSWRERSMRLAVLSHIRRRPRDLVTLCKLAAREAGKNNRSTITSQDIDAVRTSYSQGILDSLVKEHEAELPAIGRLLLRMRPTKKDREARHKPWRYREDEIVPKLKTIIRNDSLEFSGTPGEPQPIEMLEFLHRIDFLVARKDQPGAPSQRRYYEGPGAFASLREAGYSWEVHFLYRKAIDTDDVPEADDPGEP